MNGTPKHPTQEGLVRLGIEGHTILAAKGPAEIQPVQLGVYAVWVQAAGSRVSSGFHTRPKAVGTAPGDNKGPKAGR